MALDDDSQLAIQTENELLAENDAAVERFAKAAAAENTRRAYKADWEGFVEWCSERSFQAAPAAGQTVARYLADLGEAGYKATTISRKAVAIGQAHQTAGEPDPTKTKVVRTILRGIRRELGIEPDGARPARVKDIRRMVDWVEMSYDDKRLRARDRALLLVGFAGAFRRSELVGVDVEDLRFVDEGLVIRMGKTKTDQEAEGMKKGIPKATPRWCPVRAIEDWMRCGNRSEGPLFVRMDRWGNVYEDRLSDRAISRLVKKAIRGIGKDPADYSAHSLRAGLATSAAEAGKPERAIMDQTGHRSLKTVRSYIREGELFRGNAAEGLL